MPCTQQISPADIPCFHKGSGRACRSFLHAMNRHSRPCLASPSGSGIKIRLPFPIAHYRSPCLYDDFLSIASCYARSEPGRWNDDENPKRRTNLFKGTLLTHLLVSRQTQDPLKTGRNDLWISTHEDDAPCTLFTRTNSRKSMTTVKALYRKKRWSLPPLHDAGAICLVTCSTRRRHSGFLWSM